MICVFYVWLPGQYRRQLPSASLSVSDMTMMKNEDDVKASDDDSDEDSDDDDDDDRFMMKMTTSVHPVFDLYVHPALHFPCRMMMMLMMMMMMMVRIMMMMA